MKASAVAAICSLLLAAPLAAQDVIPLSPPPGTYGRSLSVTSPLADTTELQYAFGAAPDHFFELNEELRLGALAGEERRYELLLRRAGAESAAPERAVYIVDRRAPAAPEIAPAGAVSSETVRLTFRSDAAGVKYQIDSDSAAESTAGYRSWNGSPIALPAPEQGYKSVTVRAFAVDRPGNRSAVATERYVLRTPHLRIAAPSSGSYENRQLLVVNASSWLDVRYTVDGNDPLSGGARYDAPLLLPAGSVTLRVAARRSDGTVLRDRVELQSGDGRLLRRRQGSYASELRLTLPRQNGAGEPVSYAVESHALSSRVPPPKSSRFSAPMTEAITLRPARGAVHGIALFARAGEELYAYHYVMDGRAVRSPAIVRAGDTLVPTAPEATRLELSTARGASESLSKSGVPASTLYAQGGTLRARIHYWDGRRSETTELTLPEQSTPQAPRVSVSPDGTLSVDAGSAPAWGYRVVSGTAAQSTALVTPSVPSLKLEAPFGYEHRVSLDIYSISESGELSEPVRESVEIDARPPPAPTVTRNGRQVSIEGEGHIFYRLQRGDEERSGDPSFLPYREPLEVGGLPGSYTRHTAEAYAEDSRGNRSAIVRQSIVVDRRSPRLPPIRGVRDGGRYSGPVSLWFISEQDPPDIRFEYSRDGTEPPDPTRESPLIDGHTRFEGMEGGSVRIRLKLLPTTTSRSGSVTALSFTIDRVAPSPPTLDGVAEGDAYSSSRTVSLSAGDGTDEIVVSLRRGGETREFVYDEPFVVTVPEGAEEEFTLAARARDAAGNSSQPQQVSFRVDRRSPRLPALCVLPAGGSEGEECETRLTAGKGASAQRLVANDAIRVSPAGNAAAYYYQRADGEWLRFDAPLAFSAAADSERSYRLYLRAVDAAGNESAVAGPFQLTVDRKAPLPPAEPSIEEISGSGGRERFAVSWPDGREGSERVEYRIGEGVFSSYREEAVALSGGVVLYYRAVDAAGNRSSVRSLSIGSGSLPTPQLTGAANGGVYSEAVSLGYNGASQHPVRYEVAVDGESVPEVTARSPLLTQRQLFDVADNTELRYTVHVRAVAEDGGRSNLASTSFRVDRKAPPEPALAEYADGSYVSRRTELRFARQNARIWYRLERTVQRADSSRLESGESYREAPRTITVEPEENARVHYRIYAYAEDAAGNRSSTRTWDIYADTAVVYVSAQSGGDPGSGTRADPFGTLQRAVEEAARMGRGTVFVTTGSYGVSGAVNLPSGLTITGGFDPESWSPNAAATTIAFRSDVATGGGLRVDAGSVRLERLHLRSAAAERSGANGALSRLFDVAGGGKLVLADVRIEAGGAAPLIRSRGSAQVELTDSTISDIGSLIDARGAGRLVVRESSLRGGDGGGELALIAVEGGAINISRSELIVPSAVRAIAVAAHNADVSITDSELAGNREAGISLLVSAIGGELSALRNTLSLEAENGAVGVRVESGRATIERNRFEAIGAGDFSYAVTLRSAQGSATNNRIVSAESAGSFIGARLVDSTSTWSFNTIAVNSTAASAVNVEGRGDTELFANRLESRSGGSAIYHGNSGGTLELRSNCFSGWESSLVWPRERGSSPGALWRIGTVSQLNQGLIAVNGTAAFRLAAQDNRSAVASGACGAGVSVSGAGGRSLPTTDIDGAGRPGRDGRYTIGAEER